MGMIDMMGNINDFMNLYQQLKSNPVQFLSRRFNIPQNINNPNDIIQHLLNTGQVTQEQVNQVMGMKNNPVLKQIMENKQ
jgi:rRNA pseudouridine-1189 N-methylase Emg1 (Nep1/Mra1 family)